MEQLRYLRSNFEVPQQTLQILQVLAKQIPLVTITNGKVYVECIGLADYFSLVLKAGQDGYAKPYCQMFDKAIGHLQFAPAKVLNVGDHLLNDVNGDKDCGIEIC